MLGDVGAERRTDLPARPVTPSWPAAPGRGSFETETYVNWLTTLLSGRPHFIIGGADNPYMLRWWLIPRNRFLNVYLHKFCRDDYDRALHDHPFLFVSVMLRGKYIEHYPGNTITRSAPSVALRPAWWQHRVELPKRLDGSDIPCWTLVVTGPRTRTWGFHCGERFVPWYEFVDDADTGRIGKGCGEA